MASKLHLTVLDRNDNQLNPLPNPDTHEVVWRHNYSAYTTQALLWHDTRSHVLYQVDIESD